MHFEVYREGSGNALLWALTGQWRWRLRAANGEIIASGESYHNRADCTRAIDLVKRAGPLIPVQDL